MEGKNTTQDVSKKKKKVPRCKCKLSNGKKFDPQSIYVHIPYIKW